MKRTTAAVALLAGAFLAAFYAVTPRRTLDGLGAAIRGADEAELAERIDFERLRASLRDRLDAAVRREIGVDEASPLGEMTVGVATMLVGSAVESFVTPAGLASLARGLEPGKNGAGAPFEDARISLRGPDRFVATVPASGEPVRFEFERRGLRWKLVAVSVPDALVPGG